MKRPDQYAANHQIKSHYFGRPQKTRANRMVAKVAPVPQPTADFHLLEPDEREEFTGILLRLASDPSAGYSDFFQLYLTSAGPLHTQILKFCRANRVFLSPKSDAENIAQASAGARTFLQTLSGPPATPKVPPVSEPAIY